MRYRRVVATFLSVELCDPLTHEIWYVGRRQSHLHTRMIYKIGFIQSYYMFTLILPIKIVMCGKSPWTEFIHNRYCDVKSATGEW